MRIFSILLIPLIIAAIPLLMMLGVYNFQSKINSFWRTLIAVLLVILIGFFTPFFAILVSVKGYAQNGIQSATGSVVFLPIGCAFSFTAIILGIISCMRSFKKSKIKFNENISLNCS